jgi:membrane-associated PAP2 superfamily phosphatase
VQVTHRNNFSRFLAVSGFALLALIAWDWGGLDLPLARWFGTHQGFALQDNWLLTAVMHKNAHGLSWAFLGLLTAGIRWPVGPLRKLPLSARVQLVVTALIAALAISLLKSVDTTSCPWDLVEFGGSVPYLSHWDRIADGGPGHCFPAGHASAGFAFLGGYFVFRPVAPGLARRWLWGALMAGLILGLSQQMRGAHFMSHTLWTGWVCWCIAGALDGAFRAVQSRKSYSLAAGT